MLQPRFETASTARSGACLTAADGAADDKARGDVYFRRGDYLEAVHAYESYLASSPPDPGAAWSNLSIAALKAGDLALAESAARSAIGCRARWGKAHARLGAALAAQDRFVEARVALERAAELDPGMAQQVGDEVCRLATHAASAAQLATVATRRGAVHRLAVLCSSDEVGRSELWATRLSVECHITED